MQVATSRPLVRYTALVFIAFLVPLGLYLLLLGWVNRQPRPVMVSGTWDFIGVLFAASGFLLVGGPAVLSSQSERWRMAWMLGEAGRVTDGLDASRRAALFQAGAYFALVVGVSAWVLARRRGTTAIYNVEPGVVEGEVEAACEALGLGAIRSGGVFVFGMALDPPSRRPAGIQAPHALRRAAVAADPVEEVGELLAGQNAVLEIETFPAMRHVTLRWDAPDTPLRPVVEAELDKRLARAGVAYHDTGAWLTMVGSAMLGLAALTAFALVMRLWTMR